MGSVFLMLSTITSKGSLSSRDQETIWHPFTQALTSRDPIPIVRAQGVFLYAVDGKRYLDAISSWWVNLHGHAHPYIANKISEQAHILEHVIFADFTHPKAIELAEKLLSLLPSSFSKVFYSDNGSTAVETAIKMAIQYWHNDDPNTPKKKVICFKGSYHGDTFGAMSSSGKNDFNKPFWKHLFEIEMIDPPLDGKEDSSLMQLANLLDQQKCACFIFEPLILGVGGMIMYPPAGLDALLSMCRKHEIVTIADEVMTGFGRTGPLFACEYLKQWPDILCLSKGLSGGFLPLGATICNEKIFNRFLSQEHSKALLHGHSYSGNPLSCTASLASLELLEKGKCSKQRAMIAEKHKSFCALWKDHPKLIRCESLGTILVLEYRTTKPTSYFNDLREHLYSFFLEHRILLRPFGNVLHVMPPYCINSDELDFIYRHIIITLENLL
jgi:adenosylmethionine---8-amino-7-oxononanoate aminotransferase